MCTTVVHSDGNEIPKIPRVRTHIRCSPVLDPLHMFARRSARHAVIVCTSYDSLVCTSAHAIQWLASYWFFGISLATTVVDVARHRVDYMSLVIARCLDPFAPCIVCRSPAPGLWQASKLLFDTLSVSVCLVCHCSEVHWDLYSNTSSAKLQSVASTYLYDNHTFVRYNRERLETRLVLYLAGTAAVEDWVMRAAALSGCIWNSAKGLQKFRTASYLTATLGVEPFWPLETSCVFAAVRISSQFETLHWFVFEVHGRVSMKK